MLPGVSERLFSVTTFSRILRKVAAVFLSIILVVLTSWNPLGPSRPVTGLLYLSIILVVSMTDLQHCVNSTWVLSKIKFNQSDPAVSDL
jgi:hypothetical protein